jgi:hypothetical protein
MIEDAKNGKIIDAEDYNKLFIKIMNKPEVFVRENEL